jgi:trigger factor
MRSSSEVLEGNKVKLSVEIDEEELESAVDETVRRLQREVNMPGFRPGRVPRRLLEARLGGKAIREEVIRHALPDYYAQAVEEAALDTIAAPEIDITAGEDEGPLAFDAVVEVRPKVSIAGYEGLVVTVPSPEATEEEVEAQLDRMRQQFAELRDVERPATDGDVVTVDVQATRDGQPVEDLATSDFVYEVGTGMLAEGADEALRGAKAGDILEIDGAEAPGGAARLKILVKQVREKILPAADDDWASDASEFETLAELRDDIRGRMTGLKRLQARIALREQSIEALAALVAEDVPAALVDEETIRVRDRFLQQLAESRIALEQYLEATGRTPDELVEEFRSKAADQARADLALRALAEAQELSVTDDDLAAEMARLAEEAGRPVREVARQIAGGPGIERLRSEVRNSKAVTWLTEHVDVVDDQGKPMDRALLLEQDAEKEDSAEGQNGAGGADGSEDRAEANTEIVEVTGADDGAVGDGEAPNGEETPA